MGVKRLKWKHMSYQEKEALCWCFYENIENPDMKHDPKIKVWALEKLKYLGLLNEEEKYTIIIKGSI